MKESELSKESVWQVMILFGTRLSGMHVLGLSIFNGDASMLPLPTMETGRRYNQCCEKN